MKIRIKSASPLGQIFYPDCPITRALCMSKFKPGRRENPMVTKSDVTAFRNEDFEVEYRGFKSDWLDSIGAIRKIAKKEEQEEEEGE